MTSRGDNYSIPGRFCTEFSLNFRRNSIRFARVGRFCTEFSSCPRVLRGRSNTSRARSRHSLLSNDFRYINYTNVLMLQWRTPDRCLYRVSVLLFSTLLTFVSFGLATIMCCMPICYMLVWNEVLLPRPHFIPTSWLSSNRLTF